MKIDSNHIYIPASQSAQGLFKYQLSGSWSARHQAWRFPKSICVLDEIAKYAPQIAQTHTFKENYTRLKESRDRLRAVKTSNLQQDEGDRLRPYQRQDVQYLAMIPHAGVFNQPRTGKTPTMIETIKARHAIRSIIICPASLQYNWKREIEQWHPEAKIFLYNGTPKQRSVILEAFVEYTDKSVGYLIMSKDTAKRDVDSLAIRHDACVVDEAHYLRNEDTLQTKAVYTIGYQAKHRYALTGTPTVKHPADVFGILKFLYPHKFTSYWQFVERYFDITDNGFGKEVGEPKPSRIAELSDLIDAMTTQRLRKDVMQWLPDKQYHVHTCQMSTKQQKLYKSMLEDFFAKHEDIEIDTQNVLSQLMRLRQLCLDPALLGFNVPSAKTDALLEAIEDGTYDQPIVIMSMFTSYLKLLEPEIKKMGKRIGMIHGEMSNKEKNDTAQAFQAGKIDVLLCNIISAGTGFTLDKGEVIIFTDKAWNPSDNEQAEDRITPTQRDRVHKHFIVSFVCENTIDAHIEQLLSKKESLTAIVNECRSWTDFRKLFVYN